MSEQVTLVGIVRLTTTGAGSKSEMTSVVLDPLEGEGSPVVLRPRDPSSLEVDPDLAAYAGLPVVVTGHRAWTSVVVDSITALEAPAEE